MTSTVLDVSVMLLCVSASVLALSPGGIETGAETTTASEVADRLSTETVTVTYADPSAPGGNRTVHATRAELLALLAVGADGARGGARDTVDTDIATTGVDTAASNGFERRALAVVTAGLDARTRIDARVLADDPSGRSDRSNASGRHRSPRATADNGSVPPNAIESSAAVTVGNAPPRNTDTTAAVITQPRPGAAAASEGHVRIVVRRW